MLLVLTARLRAWPLSRTEATPRAAGASRLARRPGCANIPAMRYPTALLAAAALLALAPGGGPVRAVAADAPPVAEGSSPGGPSAPRAEPSREERLARLFDRLGKAKSADEAKPLTGAIEALWMRSGSDTVDLLMGRAKDVLRADSDAAVTLLDKVVALHPEYAEGWNRRAMAYFAKKDYGHALTDIRATLDREPRHFGAWMGLARILEEFGYDKKALAAYRKVLALNPNTENIDKTVEKLAIEVEGRDI